MADGQYFLMEIPQGYNESYIKRTLADVIKYPEGIQGLTWVKQATMKEGGMMQLNLDSKAARLLKAKSDGIWIGEKRVVYVDKLDMASSASSTIDDDLLALVKEEMKPELFLKYSLKLKMTFVKGQNQWNIEGTFADIKAFELGIRSALFAGIKESSSSSSKKKKSMPKPKTEKNSSNAVSVPITEDETDLGYMKMITCKWDSNVVRMWRLDQPIPLRVEFCVGSLSQQQGVDAIVIPTSPVLAEDANPLMRSFVESCGRFYFDDYRKKLFEAQLSLPFLPVGHVVPLRDVDINAKTVLFLSQHGQYGNNIDENVKDISHMYAGVFKAAASERLATLACPPLGIESNMEVCSAAVGLSTALLRAVGNGDLVKSLDVLRLVFTNDEPLNLFMMVVAANFQEHIEGATIADKKTRPAIKKPVMTDTAPKNSDANNKNRCPICLGPFNKGGPRKQTLHPCGHEFHLDCIAQWHLTKQNCPVCATMGSH